MTLLGSLLVRSRDTEVVDLDPDDVRSLLGLAETSDPLIEEVVAFVAFRGNATARYAALRFAMERPNNPVLAELIAHLTHDPEDFIAFQAIRACGDMHLDNAIPDLLSIIGPLSERLRPGTGKPVGVGHALVMQALILLLGTDDIEQLRRLERSYFVSLDETTHGLSSAPEGMLLVQGEGVVGLDPDRFPWRAFDCSDGGPPRAVVLQPYYIDRWPVTSEQYDHFCNEVGDTHDTCHPGEPAGKSHTRNTIHDPRFVSDGPVAGVDWFDAYSYASWRGARLPTEAEWEVAARRGDDRVFPWGDRFEPERCCWAGSSFSRPVETLGDWRTLLVSVSEAVPRRTVDPIGAHLEDGDESGDWCGNVWEWTSTGYQSGSDMVPTAAGTISTAAAARSEADLAVIKGGAWSSFGDLLVPSFRGKDVIIDRHNEIGFRCAMSAA